MFYQLLQPFLVNVLLPTEHIPANILLVTGNIFKCSTTYWSHSCKRFTVPLGAMSCKYSTTHWTHSWECFTTHWKHYSQNALLPTGVILECCECFTTPSPGTISCNYPLDYPFFVNLANVLCTGTGAKREIFHGGGGSTFFSKFSFF